MIDHGLPVYVSLEPVDMRLGSERKLDAGRFALPRATSPGEHHLVVSDAIFEVLAQCRRRRTSRSVTETPLRSSVDRERAGQSGARERAAQAPYLRQ